MWWTRKFGPGNFGPWSDRWRSVKNSFFPLKKNLHRVLAWLSIKKKNLLTWSCCSFFLLRFQAVFCCISFLSNFVTAKVCFTTSPAVFFWWFSPWVLSVERSKVRINRLEPQMTKPSPKKIGLQWKLPRKRSRRKEPWFNHLPGKGSFSSSIIFFFGVPCSFSRVVTGFTNVSKFGGRQFKHHFCSTRLKWWVFFWWWHVNLTKAR